MLEQTPPNTDGRMIGSGHGSRATGSGPPAKSPTTSRPRRATNEAVTSNTQEWIYSRIKGAIASPIDRSGPLDPYRQN
ncbi:hypothetical protein AJ80_03200 [Polytolypa hystricis UAMH7299]|uniref:Uncharacterized protein n=1 Tax=Polytolypa hystricis (strain UAMH7299) TaxID=1447883 RepID=A0A2B7YL02_POLH7|nr:hypothetical protein AJ80_03200 [Polytolypa hystricis UAMH7299]